MKVFYSDTFWLPLPDGHRFPIEKYRLLRERLQAGELRDELEFCLSEAVTDHQLLLVHSPGYLNKLKRGELSPVEERRIGFAFSHEMVERSRRSTGGTLGAARAALDEGAGVHLAGGTHHAFADHGQGFCVFNDVAVAIRLLQSAGKVRRGVVLDLDVHQGNGTASIFADDPTVFTFSMHAENNFPFSKCDGDLDIALSDGTCDEDYLALLHDAIEHRIPLGATDIAFYLAGADPYEHDRLGKLDLTMAGLAERDHTVFAACKRHNVPVTVVMAGGYAKSLDDVVKINISTIRTLLEFQRSAAPLY